MTAENEAPTRRAIARHARWLAVLVWALPFALTPYWSAHAAPTEANTTAAWTVFRHNMNGLPGDNVNALSPGPDGVLWIATDAGLARLDKDGHWQTYTRDSTDGALPADDWLVLAPGLDGSLWVGSSALGIPKRTGGLARRDKDGHWQTYTKTSTNGGLPDNDVSVLLPGRDDDLWVGTWAGGLARRDKDGRWQTYTEASTNRGLSSNHVSLLALGQDEALWVSTEAGLTRLDKDGRWQTYSAPPEYRPMRSGPCCPAVRAPCGSELLAG